MKTKSKIEQANMEDGLNKNPVERPMNPDSVTGNEGKQAIDQEHYISYPANTGDYPQTSIHEYKSGRRVLVGIDIETGKEYFIRDL